MHRNACGSTAGMVDIRPQAIWMEAFVAPAFVAAGAHCGEELVNLIAQGSCLAVHVFGRTQNRPARAVAVEANCTERAMSRVVSLCWLMAPVISAVASRTLRMAVSRTINGREPTSAHI